MTCFWGCAIIINNSPRFHRFLFSLGGGSESTSNFFLCARSPWYEIIFVLETMPIYRLKLKRLASKSKGRQNGNLGDCLVVSGPSRKLPNWFDANV